MKPYPDNGCYSCYAASINQHSAIIRGRSGEELIIYFQLVNWAVPVITSIAESRSYAVSFYSIYYETHVQQKRRCVTRVAGMLKWAGYLMRVPSVYLCIDLSSRKFYCHGIRGFVFRLCARVRWPFWLTFVSRMNTLLGDGCWGIPWWFISNNIC